MPEHGALVLTLAGALTAALIFGYITHRLRLSPLVGYLLAGMVIGPFTPGLVVQAEAAGQLAEVGVVLLMFGVGLHFRLDELLAVKKLAIPGALVQSAVATALGTCVAVDFGWSFSSGLVFGLAISVASTVVLVRVLSDFNVLHTPAGHVAVGWLIVEDLFTVLVLVLLPAFAGLRDDSTGGAWPLLSAVGLALVKLAVLMLLTSFLGRRVLPKILEHVARTRSRELFTLAVLAVALGIAVVAAQLFNASMALGAFLAGMAVGQSEFSSRAGSEALPLRDAFAVLFFVSVGMLFDPRQLLDNIELTLAVFGIIMVAKPLTAFVTVRLLRGSRRTALTVAFALGQIGEFSFILGALGLQLGFLPAAANQALIAASIASITITPLLFRLVEPLSRRTNGAAEGLEELAANPDEQPGVYRAIVVGYGPVGRTLCRLLRENEVEPTVVELNLETVRMLKARGVRTVYGDASQTEILQQAGVQSATSLVFTASGTPPEGIVRAARQLNPQIRVIARSQYLADVEEARRAGADRIVTAEAEVAIAMAEVLLGELGATPDQLDRVRHQVREELFGPS